MTEKDLRKMSRSELLEILIDQAEENKMLKIRLQRAENMLNERKIAIEKAGSIAEAALRLNGVFEAAEAAAKQYLDNIKFLNERAERIYMSEAETAERSFEVIAAEVPEYKNQMQGHTVGNKAYGSERNEYHEIKKDGQRKSRKKMRAVRNFSYKLNSESNGDE